MGYWNTVKSNASLTVWEATFTSRSFLNHVDFHEDEIFVKRRGIFSVLSTAICHSKYGIETLSVSNSNLLTIENFSVHESHAQQFAQ